MNKDLKQGQRIEYKVGQIEGFGKIVGVANNGQPIIGSLYIIEPEIPITNEIYPYSHFVLWETQFKLVN